MCLPRARNRGSSRSNEIKLVADGAAAWVSLCAYAAQHDRLLLSPDFRHRTEGEDTPLREETTTANDDRVGMVNVPLVADVIQPAELRAVAREHPVAPGGGEKPAEFCLCPVAPPIPTLLHGGKSSDGSRLAGLAGSSGTRSSYLTA
jgi:hypothetical protein